MNVLIVEDEQPAVRRLEKLLQNIDGSIRYFPSVDTVKEAVSFLKQQQPDLLFLDIQLADGLSLEIFKQVDVKCPVIFTTAYDHYAIQAIKLNSVDYLLKPIDEKELKNAFEKAKKAPSYALPWKEILQEAMGAQKKYKKRFLIKTGDQWKTVESNQIAYFLFADGCIELYTLDGKKVLIDGSLDQLAMELNPDHFFRINRKLILNSKAICKIHSHFNSRLKLDLTPEINDEIIVSRERVADFKTWLDS